MVNSFHFSVNIISRGKGKSAGTTVATITITKANSYLFPLPPLSEQHRIVERIEEILPLIESL